MLSKREILKAAFEKIAAIFVFEKYFGVASAEVEEARLLDFISKDTYSTATYTGIPRLKYRALVKEIFPNKPINSSIKLDKWVLHQEGFRYCKRCATVKTLLDFSFNRAKSDGLNCQCKICQTTQTSETQPARQAKYKAAKLNAIMPWTDNVAISVFYSRCPKGYEVDHVIPLQGEKVRGLHVLENLQYLTKTDNIKKYNNFTAE